jgi:hypothetical protein
MPPGALLLRIAPVEASSCEFKEYNGRNDGNWSRMADEIFAAFRIRDTWRDHLNANYFV